MFIPEVCQGGTQGRDENTRDPQFTSRPWRAAWVNGRSTLRVPEQRVKAEEQDKRQGKWFEMFYFIDSCGGCIGSALCCLAARVGLVMAAGGVGAVLVGWLVGGFNRIFFAKEGGEKIIAHRFSIRWRSFFRGFVRFMLVRKIVVWRICNRWTRFIPTSIHARIMFWKNMSERFVIRWARFFSFLISQCSCFRWGRNILVHRFQNRWTSFFLEFVCIMIVGKNHAGRIWNRWAMFFQSWLRLRSCFKSWVGDLYFVEQVFFHIWFSSAPKWWTRSQEKKHGWSFFTPMDKFFPRCLKIVENEFFLMSDLQIAGQCFFEGSQSWIKHEKLWTYVFKIAGQVF